jgi:hypothetical protein
MPVVFDPTKYCIQTVRRVLTALTHIDKSHLCEHVDGGARQSLRFGGEKRLELAQRGGDGADARARAAPVGGRV